MEHIPSGWIGIEKKNMVVVRSCEALDACEDQNPRFSRKLNQIKSFFLV
jgi:hypothetical protein